MEVSFIANTKDNLLVNDRIKLKEVLVIGPNGEQVGIKSIEDALTLASYAGLDLVLVGEKGNPPVCKIMDYNKFKYEKNKKAKESLKKQKINNTEIKEFRLSPVIDVGDFETKIKQVTKYLEKDHKIKVTIRFKGRQMAHTDLGKDVLIRFAKRLEDLSEIEQNPKLDGRNMMMMLVPKKQEK
ncbi:MAG: translation initiation factor IF-3 [Tenericutes bacterium]|jgi:translation initiation factor IF-3|nr:translation initiation factor IF-3 [Mycoplasmatota bacterium]